MVGSTQWMLLTRVPDMNEDHSFSHHDCLPYYLRTGDKWTPIDYSKHPSHWMKPLEPGLETGLVEIPSNWYLDDVSVFRNPSLTQVSVESRAMT